MGNTRRGWAPPTDWPSGVVWRLRGNPFAYITNTNGVYDNGTVSVLDLGSDNVIATVPVGPFPQEVSMHPAGTFVYEGSKGSESKEGRRR